jgi:hypothetical protein
MTRAWRALTGAGLMLACTAVGAADAAAGKVKHKQKIELTPAEIANVASYWAESSK